MGVSKIGDVPILYYNSKPEDKEAYLSILEAEIPCELRAPAEEPTPTLTFGFERFVGLEEIKKFIEEYVHPGEKEKVLRGIELIAESGISLCKKGYELGPELIKLAQSLYRDFPKYFPLSHANEYSKKAEELNSWIKLYEDKKAYKF